MASPNKATQATQSDVVSRYLSHFPTVNPDVFGPPDPVIPNSSGGPDDRQPGSGPVTVTSIDTAGGSTGGNKAPSAPTAPPLDWHAYLTNWGFDQDIVDELDRIFRTYSDASAASASALAYIRGTDWYAKTFPGIQEGIKLGIIRDEQGYRSYTNQMNDLYHRYYNRTVTADEVSSALKSGYDVSHVNAHFSGQAYIAANENDFQAALGAFDTKGVATRGELDALGDQQAGLDNVLGPEVQRRITLAKQKMAGIFQGTLFAPNGQVSPTGRLIAPSLGGGISPNDVGA